MSDLFSGLNERQYEAVTVGTGPVLIFAGPGSGKTRVLTHRIAYLVQKMGVSPYEVMAVTFTNKAAGEMKARAEHLLKTPLSGMMLGTFHAMCARILRREGHHTPYGDRYHIYDTADQEAVIKQALAELNIDPKKYNPRRVLGKISAAKNELILPSQFRALDYFGEVVAQAYTRYQAIMLDNNALDFDDLLMQTVLLMQNDEEVQQKYQQRISFLLVDEFQDTNIAQYELVRLLAAPMNNVFVVGDEDQGIYAFRGADYRNVQRFREDYPSAKVVLLEQNYRSTQTVLDAARAVIDRNPHRTPKALFTERGDGAPIHVFEAYNETFEAEYIADQVDRLARQQKRNYREFAVMYRTNAQSQAIESRFITEGIPYRMVGGVGFYKRREIRDLLSYLRVVDNPNDRVSFGRIINVPRRGIGEKSLHEFQIWATANFDSYQAALAHLVKGDPSPISARAVRPLTEFAQGLFRWQALAEGGQLIGCLDAIIADTGYRWYLQEISESEEQNIDRNENVDQLRRLLADAEHKNISLNEFLTDQSLVSDVDELKEDADAVTLLTLHAAKGLEFPVVFIAGLEEGLLPHVRSFEDPDGMAEERRLMYVGITRAEDQLYLSYAFRRSMWGSDQTNSPSRFLTDLPPGLLNDMPAGLGALGNQRNFKEQTTWDAPTQKITRAASPPPPVNDSARGGFTRAETPQTKSLDKLRGKLRDKIVPFPGMEASGGKFRRNTRVSHGIFGAGMVIDSKVQGGIELVTVLFDDRQHGIKEIDGDLLGKL